MNFFGRSGVAIHGPGPGGVIRFGPFGPGQFGPRGPLGAFVALVVFLIGDAIASRCAEPPVCGSKRSFVYVDRAPRTSAGVMGIR